MIEEKPVHAETSSLLFSALLVPAPFWTSSLASGGNAPSSRIFAKSSS